MLYVLGLLALLVFKDQFCEALVNGQCFTELILKNQDLFVLDVDCEVFSILWCSSSPRVPPRTLKEIYYSAWKRHGAKVKKGNLYLIHCSVNRSPCKVRTIQRDIGGMGHSGIFGSLICGFDISWDCLCGDPFSFLCLPMCYPICVWLLFFMFCIYPFKINCFS